ncbi:acyltransferase family protein [Streptococcus saliviloxodontae]|uniref:Peptidoglycan/LPS O-acetylase OafA/YrhL n=1 Tax=Streptococcus saliviloxodontae TaxID=1349416 RepID=A0ABS2PKG6_9STRE|nr:acyltransferase family protein [Streptococcus saliviloxodontae]MBM7635925.1 peptidoglycan/LPS O-acetylase OafA/YrhL [Streptococcus saliviloxodontae]
MRIQWFSLIRVVGLLFVLTYHFFKDFLPGGFIGVDIFFTFSGYLITALLIDEFSQNRQIKLLVYLRKRLYRIFPPLVLSILISLPLALLIRQDFIAGIWKQVLASIGFVTNFYEMGIGSNYEAQFSPHLFLHTWSLSIEVHYYLLWGLLLWLLGKGIKSARSYRKIIRTISGLLFILSAGLMIWGALWQTDLSNLYFSTASHAFPLFAGSFLATLAGIKETTSLYRDIQKSLPPYASLLGAIGSGLVLISLAFLLHFEAQLTYLLGFLLASLWTSSLIFFCRLLHDSLKNRKEPALVTYLANISYSVYLFHWPLYIIFKNLFPKAYLLAVALTTLLSLLLASLSFYVIEPALMGQSKKAKISKKASYILAPLLLVCLALSIKTVTQQPHLSDFESNLMIKSLKQSANNMATSQKLALRISQNNGNASTDSQTPVADDYSNVLLIGDSVILDAHDIYPERFDNMDVQVEVGRSFTQGYDLFSQYMQSGDYDYVVVSLGANTGDDYQETIDKMIASLNDDKHLIFITPYSQEDPDLIKDIRDYEKAQADQHINVSIVDWYQIATDNPDLWVGSDGVHFSHTGETDTKGSTLMIDALLQELDRFKESPTNTSDETNYSSENVLLIGDSVSVHASEKLKQTLPQAILDPLSNRNLADAASLVQTYLNSGTLPETVIIAVGVNETSSYKENLDQIVDLLPKGSHLVLVTPYNGNYSDYPDSTVSKTASYEKELAKKNSFIQIADWVETAKAHPEIWQGTDNVHFEREDGLIDYDMLDKASGYYSDTITQALAKAQTTAGKP